MERHLTIPEIAGRMGVSAATAKRRIAEWAAGTGNAPMRPGRSIILTEEEYSQMMEYTRCRFQSSLPESERVISSTFSADASPESCAKSPQSSGPKRRRGTYAKLAEKLSAKYGQSTRPVVSLEAEKTRRSRKQACNT